MGVREAEYSETFYDSFANALKIMPRLTKLCLALANQEAMCSKLQQAFSRADLQLKIKTLSLYEVQNAAFVLRACCSLETLIATDNKNWKRTFAPLRQGMPVSRVEITPHGNWTVQRVQGMSKRNT
jgi:hypothetical protein